MQNPNRAAAGGHRRRDPGLTDIRAELEATRTLVNCLSAVTMAWDSGLNPYSRAIAPIVAQTRARADALAPLVHELRDATIDLRAAEAVRDPFLDSAVAQMADMGVEHPDYTRLSDKVTDYLLITQTADTRMIEHHRARSESARMQLEAAANGHVAIDQLDVGYVQMLADDIAVEDLWAARARLHTLTCRERDARGAEVQRLVRSGIDITQARAAVDTDYQPTPEATTAALPRVLGRPAAAPENRLRTTDPDVVDAAVLTARRRLIETGPLDDESVPPALDDSVIVRFVRARADMLIPAAVAGHIAAQAAKSAVQEVAFVEAAQTRASSKEIDPFIVDEPFVETMRARIAELQDDPPRRKALTQLLSQFRINAKATATAKLATEIAAATEAAESARNLAESLTGNAAHLQRGFAEYAEQLDNSADRSIADLPPAAATVSSTADPPTPKPYRLDLNNATAPQRGTAETTTNPPTVGVPDMFFSHSEPVQVDQHSAEDAFGQQFSALTRLLMQYAMAWAQTGAKKREAYLLAMARKADREREEAQARFDAERKGVEAKLVAVEKAGFDNLTRREVVAAVGDAASWAPHSAVATASMHSLRTYVHARFGIVLDLDEATAAVDKAYTLDSKLHMAEEERLYVARAGAAQKHMIDQVVADPSIDQSARRTVIAQIQAWQSDPTDTTLRAVNEAMVSAGVNDKTRTKVAFTALYLAGRDGQPAPVVLQRKLAEPLVAPGEAIKNRLDTLLLSYQTQLKTGIDSSATRRTIRNMLPLLDKADVEVARERGNAIWENPTGEYKPLWPDHVNRTAVEEDLRLYSMVRQAATQAQIDVDSLDAPAAKSLEKTSAAVKRRLDKVIDKGEGLHPVERSQLALTMRGIESGSGRIPEQIFADHHSGAAADIERAVGQARTSAAHHQYTLETLVGKEISDPVLRAKLVSDSNIQHHLGRLATSAGGADPAANTAAEAAVARLDVSLNAYGLSDPIRAEVNARASAAITDAAKHAASTAARQERWNKAIYATAKSTVHAPVGHPAEHKENGAQLTPEQMEVMNIVASTRSEPPAAAARTTGRRGPRKTTPGAGMDYLINRAIHGPDEGTSPGTGIGD
ncbi:hypothetical protein [Nocardia sp. NPDC060249]|uniref:hypothetical protein n=1 Tax=Nocardia sp. NPDC060249 TaxID=3347082 RepID=UPI00365E8CF7